MVKGLNNIYKLLILLLSLGMGGCAAWGWNGTQVNTDNRLVSKEGETEYCAVYFLRPLTERAMGFSDNALTIDLDGSKLLTLEKGDYTLVYMRPRVRTTMTVENRTEVGPYWLTKKMTKDYEFGFAAGETYFPEGMPEVSFYEPTDRGLEAKIAEKLARLRELDEAANRKKQD